MAQGKLKVKNKGAVPSKGKKQKAAKKAFGLNKTAKGARYIAPKKAKLKEAEKLRKGLETSIKNNIEHELKERATKEGKPFRFIALPKALAGARKKPKFNRKK